MIGTLATAAILLSPHPTGADSLPVAFVQVPASEAQSAGSEIGNSILGQRYLLGMRVVTAEFGDIVGTARVASNGFTCATDPIFSHDGKRLAFAGKRQPQDPLQVWELAGGAADARRIVACKADCVSPVYMPDGQILFASLLSGEYEEHGGRYSFSLYAMPPDGDSPTRLTFNPSSDFDPTVLPDGRILYSSWQHVGNHHWPRGNVAMMLINSDGTGIFPLTGNHRNPWLKSAGVALAGARIAFIHSDGLDDFGAGSLLQTSMNDAFAPYVPVIRGSHLQVAGVAPLPGSALLISARPADKADATFGLYVYEDGAARLLYDTPEYHELAPAVGAPAALPDRRFSTVVSDVPYGYLAILNCYETDRTDQHHVKDGSVKAVRVIEGKPLRRAASETPTFFSVEGREKEPLIRPSSATGYIPSRILGEVPPADDGSVYMKVPADRPLRLQLIDQDGFAIVSERAWFWVRPNERRVCIGCHENRELSPNNTTALATRQPPVDLTDPTKGQTVTFRKDIQPILTKNCSIVGCHVPPRPTADMNLTADRLNGDRDAALADRFGPAYANLLARQDNKPFGIGGRRVHPGDARSSPMMWMLYGRALAPQFKPAPFETPMLTAHPGPMLPEAQLDLIRKWIDLGAQYDEESPAGPWPYEIPPTRQAGTKGESDARQSQ